MKELFPEVKDCTIYSGSLTPSVIEKEGELFRTDEEKIVSESFFEIFILLCPRCLHSRSPLEQG